MINQTSSLTITWHWVALAQYVSFMKKKKTQKNKNRHAEKYIRFSA